MIRRLAAILALAALPVSAGTPLAFDVDIDSLSYFYPVLYTPGAKTGPGLYPGNGWSNGKKVTTSDVASTTVTAVTAADDAFAAVDVGDYIVVGGLGRMVTAKASADSITVGAIPGGATSTLNIPAAGQTFLLWKHTSASDAEAGWFRCSEYISLNILLNITQISVTGGLDYIVEGRHALAGGGYSAAFPIVATTNKTAVSVSQAAYSLSGTAQGPWDQCRIGLKVGTADDDVITIGASSDNIDWVEYVNSHAIDGAKTDLDFVEDAGGTPKVCVADASGVPDPGTGAAWCTQIALAMNNAACTPDNTYSCSYSTTTHKFTLARATGTKTIDLLWNTGTNVATSIGPTMGYSAAADDTGATSYASDTATGESAEINTVLDAGIYATGALACAEVEAEMQGDAVAATIDCAYDSATDKITLSATGITQLMILWNSGTNNATSADQHLGFSADSTGALSYLGAAIGMDDSAEVEKVTITVAGYK